MFHQSTRFSPASKQKFAGRPADMSDRQRTNGSKEGPETMPADPTEDRQSASRYSVPALEKGLEILELLAQEPWA
jgi:hypothetical protein